MRLTFKNFQAAWCEQKLKASDRGFSVLELTVAVGVVGILVTTGFNAVDSAKRKMQDGIVKTQLHTIAKRIILQQKDIPFTYMLHPDGILFTNLTLKSFGVKLNYASVPADSVAMTVATYLGDRNIKTTRNYLNMTVWDGCRNGTVKATIDFGDCRGSRVTGKMDIWSLDGPISVDTNEGLMHRVRIGCDDTIAYSSGPYWEIEEC